VTVSEIVVGGREIRLVQLKERYYARTKRKP